MERISALFLLEQVSIRSSNLAFGLYNMRKMSLWSDSNKFHQYPPLHLVRIMSTTVAWKTVPWLSLFGSSSDKIHLHLELYNVNCTLLIMGSTIESSLYKIYCCFWCLLYTAVDILGKLASLALVEQGSTRSKGA
jgi:hypothetical protein